mmetsp:Transcript_17889/g.34900  ORF Transcript_17889/g.34900 Transcript_17889/m.34900 type:complete len:383 (+) Transcript_17889:70-1218(+)
MVDREDVARPIGGDVALPPSAAAAAAAAAADAAAAAARPTPPRATSVSVKVAQFSGAFVHSLILSLGMIFLLHVLNVGVALNAQGQWSNSGELMVSFRDGFVLLVRNLLLPFAEASFLDPLMPESPGIDVWGFWVPGMLSFFFILTATLGIATIRGRRPSRAIPYAVCAAVFLVWKAQMSQAFIELASWESLGEGSRIGRSMPKHAQRVQQYLFKVGRESFSQLYTEHKCTVTARVDDVPRRMYCKSDSVEAKIIPIIVRDFCRSRPDDGEAEFDARIRGCKNQAHRLGLLNGDPSDSDGVYCSCWSAVFDALRLGSRWVMMAWVGLLMGVLSALYVAVEPRLACMGVRERSEVLAYAATGAVLLAFKAIMYPDSSPLSRGD